MSENYQNQRMWRMYIHENADKLGRNQELSASSELYESWLIGESKTFSFLLKLINGILPASVTIKDPAKRYFVTKGISLHHCSSDPAIGSVT